MSLSKLNKHIQGNKVYLTVGQAKAMRKQIKGMKNVMSFVTETLNLLRKDLPKSGGGWVSVRALAIFNKHK
jgi:hypothetical protein